MTGLWYHQKENLLTEQTSASELLLKVTLRWLKFSFIMCLQVLLLNTQKREFLANENLSNSEIQWNINSSFTVWNMTKLSKRVYRKIWKWRVLNHIKVSFKLVSDKFFEWWFYRLISHQISCSVLWSKWHGWGICTLVSKTKGMHLHYTIPQQDWSIQLAFHRSYWYQSKISSTRTKLTRLHTTREGYFINK